MNTFVKFSCVSVVLIVLFISTLAGKRKPPKPPPTPKSYHVYVSKDTNINQFLPYILPIKIEAAEEMTFIRLEGSRFAMSFMPMNWYRAFHFCKKRGAYLMKAGKYIEVANYLLKMNSPDDWKVWTAATSASTNEIYRDYVTGNDVNPNCWAPGEPSEKFNACVLLQKSDVGYSCKSVTCNGTAHALCEMLEKHIHSHTGVDLRTKLRTSKMKTLWSWDTPV